VGEGYNPPDQKEKSNVLVDIFRGTNDIPWCDISTDEHVHILASNTAIYPVI
jgi:hypothetical protein